MTNIAHLDPPTKQDLKRWEKQEEILFQVFRTPMTMMMASKRSGVMRESVCRRVGEWKASGKIKVIRIDRCEITGKLAQWLTTNPDLWPRPIGTPGIQTDLFQ